MIPDFSSLREIRSFFSEDLSQTLKISRDVAFLEIDILLLKVLSNNSLLNKIDNRAKILSNLNTKLDSENYSEFIRLVEQRRAGEPIAYITKSKEFFGYDFFVDKRVLVPRPETEILVLKALEIICQDTQNKTLLLDVGVGSGAILCATLLELKARNALSKIGRALGIDISQDALNVSRINIERFGLSNKITLLEGSLLNPLIKLLEVQEFKGEKLNLLILSNPPYLDRDDEEICAYVRSYEPELALFSDQSGFAHLERLILEFAETYLKWQPHFNTAHLFLEIGHNQANRLNYFAQKWPFLKTDISADLSGLTRIMHLCAEENIS